MITSVQDITLIVQAGATVALAILTCLLWLATRQASSLTDAINSLKNHAYGTRLTGRWEGLAAERGASSPLVDRGEVIGAAVRTRTGVSPVYVSVGHRIDLETAIALTLGSCRKHRLPEPTRLAHLAAAGRYAEGVYPTEALQGMLSIDPGAGPAA